MPVLPATLLLQIKLVFFYFKTFANSNEVKELSHVTVELRTSSAKERGSHEWMSAERTGSKREL